MQIEVPAIGSENAPHVHGDPSKSGDPLQDLLNQQQKDADKAGEDLQKQFQTKSSDPLRGAVPSRKAPLQRGFSLRSDRVQAFFAGAPWPAGRHEVVVRVLGDAEPEDLVLLERHRAVVAAS